DFAESCGFSLVGAGGSGSADRRTKRGGTRAGIAQRFRFRRADRLRQTLERRRLLTARLWQVAARPRSGTGRFAQETLDDPILEAVEAYDRQAPTGPEQPLRRSQALLQLVKFAVHVDTDRLKAARRRILGRARPISQRLAHHLRQLPGGRERPRCDNGPRHAPALPLLAVVPQHVGNLALGCFVKEVGGGRPFATHRHVEWPVRRESEPALR